MVPGDRPLIAIGYNYNTQKIISFIVTDNIGITKEGLTYLSKLPEQFSNVSICPIDFPLVIYKFSGSINEVDSHNKSRKSDLAMEKLGVNQCGWLWLCTAVATGTNITNFWKIFHYEVKRDNHGKSIDIR